MSQNLLVLRDESMTLFWIRASLSTSKFHGRSHDDISYSNYEFLHQIFEILRVEETILFLICLLHFPTSRRFQDFVYFSKARGRGTLQKMEADGILYS